MLIYYILSDSIRMAEVYKTVTLATCINPRVDNSIINEAFTVINGARVEVITRKHQVSIVGASCLACCDEGCDDDTDTDDCRHRTMAKYARHTLSTVFNALKESARVPDEEKLLDLWYINRDASSVDANAEGSDLWWFNYIKEHYEDVNFISCTLFDRETNTSDRYHRDQ